MNCIVFHPSSASTIWIGTPGGGLWRTTDHGTTWTVLTDNLTANLGVSGIAVNPNDTNNIYILTGDGDSDAGLPSSGVYKTTDGGQSWTSAGLTWNRSQLVKGRKILMHPTNPDILYVVSSKGIHKSVDGGLSWILVKTGNFYDIEFKPGNPSVMYTCNKIDFFRSFNGGDSWSKVTSGLISSPNSVRLAIAVTPLQPNNVYVVNGGLSGVADFLGLYKSTNNGQTFVLQSAAPNILGYNNDGSDAVSQARYDLAILASNITDNLIAVGGINVWASGDGGVNWDSSKTQWLESSAQAGQYIHPDVHAMEVSSLNNNWYVGTDGGIYFSSDNGNSWTNLSAGLSLQQIYRVSGKDAAAGGMFVGTQDNGINGFSGSIAQHVRGGDGMEVHAINGQVYAALQLGNNLYRYNGNPITGPDTWIPIQPSSGGRFVIPFEIHPNNSNTLYAAYDSIWESTNQGANWNYVPGSNLGLFTSMAISPTNPERIYAATDSGKIYRRDVAGETWTNITAASFPPNALITDICISSDPATMGLTAWVSFSGYTGGKKVFKTTNGGYTWTNASTGLPNVPVNSILFDSVYGQSVNALYAGTDLGVYYRNDVLGTWQPYNTGLPVIRVNDLEIIASENMIYAGTYGRGLWKSPLNKPCIPAKITVSGGDSAMCVGSSVGLQANPSGAASYLWSNGETTESIVTSVVGDYKVTVTASGCPPSNSNKLAVTEYGGSVTGDLEWQNTIGGTLYDELNSVNLTSDGGYILGGSSASNISGDKTEDCIGFFPDYWILKTDGSGNIQWQKTIGGGDRDFLKVIQQTTDGGYIIGGTSWSSASGDKSENNMGAYDFWIVKIDSVGGIQWENTIGGNDTDELKDLQQTSDGGYILGGYSGSNASGDKSENNIGGGDYWIVKLDQNGNILWENTIGGAISDFFTSVQQTSDGGYILVGRSGSNISGDKTENNIGGSYDNWIIKTDAFGIIQWQNTIGGTGTESDSQIDQCTDGGYIIGCSSTSNASGDKSENNIGIQDYWIVKTDGLGVVQWENTIGGNMAEIFSDIRSTTDGGYVIAGISRSGISGDKTEGLMGPTNGNDCWVIKTDSTGTIEWENTIGGNAEDNINSILQTTDGGYILGAYSDSNISGDKTENSMGNYDYWLIKLKGTGPCPAPYSNLKATNITTTTAKLNWDIRSCADDGYRLRYRVKGTNSWITVYVSTNTGFKNITGLSPGTIYEWKVGSRCDISKNDFSVYSPMSTFTTGSARYSSELAAVRSANIYPNPSNSIVNIDIDLDTDSRLSIQLFSSFGERVSTIEDIPSARGKLQYQFDASKFASGIYYCRIATDSHTSFHKIILVK